MFDRQSLCSSDEGEMHDRRRVERQTRDMKGLIVDLVFPLDMAELVSFTLT